MKNFSLRMASIKSYMKVSFRENEVACLGEKW